MPIVTRNAGVSMRERVARGLFTACGVWLIALASYFVFLRPPLLPEDLRYIGAGEGSIHAMLPGADRWLRRVFTVLGGFMGGTGLLTLLIATSRTGLQGRGRQLIMLAVGSVSVGTMSLTNLQLDSNFKWLLLLPSIAWLTGAVLLLTSGDTASTPPAN